MGKGSRLTPKQQRFVEEYLLCLNATEAAKRAGYSEKTAYSIGEENLKKPEIADVIAQHQQKASEKFQITHEAVLRELALVAFGRLPEIVDDEGNIIDEEKGAFLASVSKSESSSSSSEGSSDSRSFSYSTQNKVKALELIGKHVGLWSKANGANDGTGANSRDPKAIVGRLSEIYRKRRSG